MNVIPFIFFYRPEKMILKWLRSCTVCIDRSLHAFQQTSKRCFSKSAGYGSQPQDIRSQAHPTGGP